LRPFLLNYDKFDFEVIIIDDNSTDESYSIIYEKVFNFPRINIYKNTSIGKVSALNYGFTLVNGDIIKCVDADDVISEKLFDILLNNPTSVVIHDSYLFFDNNDRIGYNKLNNKYFESSFDSVLKYCVSPPRWVWSFPYSVGLKIFPIPDVLPFEDVWFSLVLNFGFKSSFLYINMPLYHYRQHNNQTYGGLLNFSESIVRFRANRLLIYYKYLYNENLFSVKNSIYSKKIDLYNYVSLGDWSFFSFIRVNSFFKLKIKFFFILFFPSALKCFYRFKYKL
jgi:glycosyltransferase involved in cell wall biosynthesis